MKNLRNKFVVSRVVPALAWMVLLASCGSSDSTITPGGGGTGTQETSVAVGPISGFGSVIINGVRYDDSSARVGTDAGDRLSSGDLRLGMMVEVRGVTNSASNTGTATSITVFSEIKGLIESATATSVVVSGITIAIVPSTVFDDFLTPQTGDFVEVYGIFDSSNATFIATRIERKSADGFKLRGNVSNWDSVNNQFLLGNTLVNYSGTSLPVGFGNGVSVRAGATVAPGSTDWSVSDVWLVSSGSGNDGDRAEIVGVVNNFISASNFSLNGLAVDGSSATFKDGVAGDLADGRWLEVEGNFANGRLIATEIEFEDGSGGSVGSQDDSFEITGRIENFNSQASFFVRNTQIDASQSPLFERGAASDLANGVCVEVKGEPVAGQNGTVIQATRVKFDNDCL